MMSSAQQNHRSGPVVIAANGSAYSDLAVNCKYFVYTHV